MKLKKLSIAVMFGCAMASGAASAIVVGGVDFGSPGTSHLETTTLAETYVDGDGQVLRGYGQINTVNGNLFYTTNPGDRLYFVFNSYTSQNFTGTSVEFTGGVVDIYIGPTFNLLGQDSLSNEAIIASYTPWVRLMGHDNLNASVSANATLVANGTLTGATLSFTGQGLLDVDLSGAFGMADVAAFLNGDSIVDNIGNFADIQMTTSGSSAVSNSHDPACTFAAGQYGCIEGSADIRGLAAIPEPATVALMGLGLVGFGAVKRRRSGAKAA